MNETMLTLRGNVGGDVTVRRAGETPVASFRLACTPRIFKRETGAWIDDETQWYTVNAWRQLGRNCAASLRRGDPVVVHGRLRINRWVGKDDVEHTTLEIEASVVGHDLVRGTTTFTKNPRPAQEPPAGQEVAA